MRYHYIPKLVANFKKIVITPNAGKDAEKLDHSWITVQNVKRYSHSEKEYSSFSFPQN